MVSMQICSQKSGLKDEISDYGGNDIFSLLQNIPETENEKHSMQYLNCEVLLVLQLDILGDTVTPE